MSDERTDELLERVRTLEADPRALARIKAGLAEKTAARPQAMTAPWIVAGAGVCAALVIWWVVTPAPRAWTEVAADTQRELHLESARAVAHGPSRFRVDRDTLELERGRLEIEGEIGVHTEGCELCIEGRSTVEASSRGTQVVILAGSATPDGPAWACHFERLQQARNTDTRPETRAANTADALTTANTQDSARAEIGERSRTGQTVGEASPRPSPRHPVAPRRIQVADPQENDDLADQVEAYRAARTLLHHDDSAALRRLHDFVARYPNSTLRHEAELDILATLQRLERTSRLAREARAFLRRWPNSPRRSEVRNLIEGAQ